MKVIGKATTLKELKQLVGKAIEICGEDCDWNGFDDGHIYIYGKRDRTFVIKHKPKKISPAENKEWYSDRVKKGELLK